jgi:hypothetical protein
MIRIVICVVIAAAMVAGGTASAFAWSAAAESGDAVPPLDAAGIIDVTALANGTGQLGDVDLMPAPLPGRSVSINGGFHGEWGKDSGAELEPPGAVAGIYGTVAEPDGTTFGWFGGIWQGHNGEPTGYLQGRYADGYFWGTWHCLESGAGGPVGGTYGPAADAANDTVKYFVGQWATADGQQTGYLKGTWSPLAQSQPGGRFAGQWSHDPAISAADVAADGSLRGRYRALDLADGTSMHFLKGGWRSNDGAHGRICGLALAGRVYGLWKSAEGDAHGYLQGSWADNAFRGSWGRAGHQPEGRLWGRYGPSPTPQPVEPQPTALQATASAGPQANATQPVGIPRSAALLGKQ